jgi:hypothetical protein
MSLAKFAQVTDDISPDEFIHAPEDESFEDEVDNLPADDEVVLDEEEEFPELEISLPEGSDDSQHEVVIVTLPAIPGSDLTDEDLAEITVDEPEEIIIDDKPVDIWDWKHFGIPRFFEWTNERISGIPKHSGHDIGGVERAIAYLETLKKSISTAIRTDLKGELDIAKVEAIRESIEDGIERLEKRLEQLVSGKSKKKKKADSEYGITKKAQRGPSVGGIIVTVPLLISKIARVCINGHISAGKDIEDLIRRQIEKYKLSDREQAELVQLVEDMGYPVFRDRGFLIDEDYDRTSEDNFDAGPNYPA